MNAVAGDSPGWTRILSTGLLLGVAAMLLVTLGAAAGSDKLAYDFHASYLPAADALRAEGTPYVEDAELPYVYPPVLAEVLLPLTYVPEGVASFLAFVASFAAVMGALALVGVRDVRCFAALVIWAPCWNALEMANVTALLMLLVALAWRYRDAPWASAGALGAALSLKLFLWPLLFWALVTRRVRTALLAVAIGSMVVLAAWAAIGFAGLVSFPEQLREVDFDDSYSFVGIAASLGLDPIVGRVATILFGVGLLVVVGYFGRQRDDARAFACAVVAALALTPVVWLHYLVFMAVPLGIRRPTFSALWLLPIVLWIVPRDDNGAGFEPLLPMAVVVSLLAGMLVRPGSRTAALELRGQTRGV